MHLQGWPECKAGGTAAQLQLKAQRTSGPTDEWNQLTVLTGRLTSSLSHCHYRSLQGANLCLNLEHFRTTNSVQCRPKRMQNLTAWQPLLQTLNFVWGMAWQHGMAADMATDVAINSVGPSSTGKSRPQLKRSRFDPILVCLTFNGYQHFIKLQMSSLYPRDSMFANAHCEASSKVTASNLKAWIWGTCFFIIMAFAWTLLHDRLQAPSKNLRLHSSYDPSTKWLTAQKEVQPLHTKPMSKEMQPRWYKRAARLERTVIKPRIQSAPGRISV